ncbi:MAG: peptidoglycan DD-metalloendopeptidase family protein [Desulfobacterales bacterium]|nr:peptidoglycan DD-metalloendopeptidase family protein [Desulfobacterales bacterium]
MTGRLAGVILGVLILVSAFPEWCGAGAVTEGTVTAARLNVRGAPSQKGVVIRVLEKGDRVSVLKISGGIGGWLTIRYRNSVGYVRNRPIYVKLDSYSHEKKEKLKASRNKIQNRIKAEQNNLSRFSEKEAELIEGLNIIDYALNQARVKAGTLERENRVLESRIKEIQGKQQQLISRIEANKIYTGKRLAALYRVHMIGRLDMGGSPESPFDYVVKQNALKRIIQEDIRVLTAQDQTLAQLSQVNQDLSGKLTEKSGLETELNYQIRIQEKESRKKTDILKEIQRKKELSRAAVAALEASARALDSRMQTIGNESLYPLSDGEFVNQKGRLVPPVDGKVISRFGDRKPGSYNSFTFQSGIDIKVKRGEPVRSVFRGEVIFSDWLIGYGNLIIINHGDNYYSLYAHVQEVFKKKGETVDTGEMIATAGDAGSLQGLCLHFEIRHHGKAVNPLKWLKIGV